MPAKTCKHNQQEYQCKQCFVEKCALGQPTLGWHQPCGKLFTLCKCEPNKKLRDFAIKWFEAQKLRHLNDIYKHDFFVHMLNKMKKIQSTINLDSHAWRLCQITFNFIMSDDTTSKKFDNRDRLDLCRFLGIITKKEYAMKWAELNKSENLIKTTNEDVVDNGGSSKQITLPVANTFNDNESNNGLVQKQINLPVAETVDLWLKNINLLQYSAAIKAYGFTDLADFQTVTEKYVAAMVNDPDVNMNKLHRHIFMEHWKERFSKINCGDKRTCEQAGQFSTNQQIDTKKMKSMQSFEVNGTNDTNGESGNAADSASGNVDSIFCNGAFSDCEDDSEDNFEDTVDSGAENVDFQNCNAADSINVNANNVYSNAAKVDIVNFDIPLIGRDFSAESFKKLLFTNETVIHLCRLEDDNRRPPDDDCKATFGEIKNDMLQDDPDDPDMWISKLWPGEDDKKLYSLNELAEFFIRDRFEKINEPYRLANIELEKRVSNNENPEYKKKIEEEKEMALNFIKNYPGTLSFDVYNRKFLRRMSIYYGIRDELVLRVHFVAKEYEIKFYSHEKDGLNTIREWKPKHQRYDGGIDLPNNKIMNLEIKSLTQEGNYFVLNYTLKRYYNNSAPPRLLLTPDWRRQKQLREEQERKQKHVFRSNEHKSISLHECEKKHEILFMKAKHNLCENMSCWLPGPDFINQMEPSVVEAQKDHKYFIMAYLRDRPENCVRSKKICETMGELKKYDEEE